MRLPPFAVFTRVKVIPDAKSQFLVTFEALGEVPHELLPTIVDRVHEAESAIMMPYAAYEEPAPKPTRGRAAARPSPKTRGGKY
jgi:hypothetical protein